MPTFTLPNFNLLCDWYDFAAPPPGGPAIFTGVLCQLWTNSRSLVFFGTPLRTIRIPVNSIAWTIPYPGTNINGYVECPSGSNNWYYPESLARVHAGFSNEYWQVTVEQIDPAAFPAVTIMDILP